ncbi:MAG: arabinose efflux permease family protein [Deltaproteobacteria bacterium]|nr:arabinose efflux permease family protein [Deltaproteobacteria bacterium]
MTTQKIVNRDFILSFFTQFVFSLVFCILIPAIPIYLLRFGAKEGEIGFLIGIFSVSSLILRPFVGKALLTIPERDFMIAGCLLYVLSCLAYLIAPPFWPLLIVRAVHGIGLAFFATASFTLLARMLPEAYRARLISYYFLSFNLAFALGPYLGMLLINSLNFSILFLVCAGLSLCSFYLTLKLRKRGSIASEQKSIKGQSFLSRGAVPPAIIAFMLNVIWGSIAAFFPLYALQHGVSNPGIFFVFLAFTLMLGRVLGGKILDVYDRKKVVTFCLSIIIIALIILPFANSLGFFILIAMMLGTGWAFLYPFLTIHVIENAGLERGPAMGTFTALADLGSGLGPMLMGFVLEKFSYPVMFGCLIFTGVINLFYFYWAIAKKK